MAKRTGWNKRIDRRRSSLSMRRPQSLNDHAWLLFEALERRVLLTLSVGPASTIETVAGGGVGDGLPAVDASLAYPSAVAVDSSGHLFIADAQNNRIREVDLGTGVITTVAGNGTPGLSGDGGPATAAELNGPSGVTVDSSDHLFIADTNNDVIREVDLATGVITTVAGNGEGGFSGDGGPATAAALFFPSGIAVDSSAHLFIADEGNNRIREVDLATRIITTVGGNGTYGFVGDGGPGTAAELAEPAGVAVDSSGHLFVADSGNNRIREVDLSTGVITTVAGDGVDGFSGDSGSATTAELFGPRGIAVDSSGHLFIADTNNGVVREVDFATGLITTTAKALAFPAGVAVDSSGHLFVADAGNNRIGELNLATDVITTVAGGGSGGSGDGGPATAAELDGPLGVAVDLSGDVFFADSGNNRVREIDVATGIVTSVAGNGTTGFSGDGGAAAAAELDDPFGVAIDSSGDLFIADSGNNRIREVDLATGLITTVAGKGAAGFSGDGGPATAAELNGPTAVAVDSSGDLFIADSGNNRIREMHLATGIITTVAGDGTYGFSGDGRAATGAELSGPEGVAVDSSGDLFIGDGGSNRIRKVDLATGVITTVAGNGNFGASGDGGPAAAAELNGPTGLAVDSSGDLFIADSGNSRIREVDLANGVMRTVAGNGTGGFTGDGGPATAAELAVPEGVAVDSSGDLFIADPGNNRIREVTTSPAPAITSVDAATFTVGTAGTFAVTDSGSPTPSLSETASLPSGVTFDPATGVLSGTPASETFGTYTITFKASNGVSPDATQIFTLSVAPASSTIQTVAGGFADGVPATAAALANPTSVAEDSSGDLFIADRFNDVVREVHHGTGVITTVAGNGAGGSSGDGGPATAAELTVPDGVAVDSSGHLFIADTDNNRIREVDLTTGVISTVAGNGTAGFSGDGGQATAAELNGPAGIAVDSSGHLFIADTDNNRIREVDLTTGVITTVAGNGVAGFSGDDGAATAAELDDPEGIAVDSSGAVFIADTFNNRIREVSFGGISTVAGDGTLGVFGDGGPSAGAELAFPAGVAVDPSGDHLFIADSDNNRIREVDLDTDDDEAYGTINTVVGKGTAGFSGDGDLGAYAELDDPEGVAVVSSDQSGDDIVIADSGNSRVRDVGVLFGITTDAGIITTVAGNGTLGFSGDGGAATAAQLFSPSGVATYPSGDLFIADTGNSRIREVDPVTGVITTAAQVPSPVALALDSSGHLFVASLDNRIREIDLATGSVINVAGNGIAGFSGDDGAATAAELAYPSGVAVDSSGDLFIADSYNNRVREVNLATGVITTVAGSGTKGFSGDGGAATAAELNDPVGVAVDSSGELFIADSGNNRIREVNLATGAIATAAGNGTAGFSGDDGAAAAAELDDPVGVAVDSLGNLFIVDSGNNCIREDDLATQVMVTVAGDERQGFSGDAGPAIAAQINAPNGLAIGSADDVFIADTGNNRIREVTSSQPPAFTNTDSAIFTAGKAASFRVKTTGVPTAKMSSTDLPSSLTLTDDGDGTATLADTSTTAAGTYQFTIDASNGVSPDATQNFTLTVTPATSSLTATVQPTATGFTATFNQAINPNVLHLYDTALNGMRPADVTLKTSAGITVPGSLVVGPTNESVTFIATSGVLPPDTYTVTLRGAADGFETSSGTLLTGNDGNNVTSQFRVASPTAATVALASVARGPGQSFSIPLMLGNASNVTSLSVQFQYDPNLLTINDNPNEPTNVSGVDASVTTPSSAVAQVTINSNSSPITETSLADLLDIQAAVPASAASDYTDTAVLTVTSVSVNGTALTMQEDDALQLVTYPGDTLAAIGQSQKDYNTSDSLLMTRVAGGADTGLAAYPLIDPALVGEVSSQVGGIGLQADALLLTRAAELSTLPSQIPPLPSPLPTTSIPAANESPDVAPGVVSANKPVASTPAISASPLAKLKSTPETMTPQNQPPATPIVTMSVQSVPPPSGAPANEVVVQIDLNDLASGDTSPASGDPIESVAAVVSFDTSKLTPVSNPVAPGSLLTSNSPLWENDSNTGLGSGVLFCYAKTNANSQNQTPGLSGSFPAPGAADDVFDITFTINSGATGTTPVYVTVDTADGPQVTAVLDAGGQPVTLNPQPADGSSDPVFGTVTLSKTTPTINWSDPAAITYGTPLGSAQLDATASVSGSSVSGNFTYTLADDKTSANGAVLNAGQNQTLNVTFTPEDTTDLATATGQVTINVNPATLTVKANNATRVYGTPNPAFSDTISGFVNGDGTGVVAGTANLTTTATAASGVGRYPITAAVGTLSAANYTFVFQSGTLTVTQAVPQITWANPADITVGQALSATQLDATANASGSFTYTLADGKTPAMGAVLGVGQDQTLNATFAPTDTTDYTTATAQASINVGPASAAPTVTMSVQSVPPPSGAPANEVVVQIGLNDLASGDVSPASGNPIESIAAIVTFDPTKLTPVSKPVALGSLLTNDSPLWENDSNTGLGSGVLFCYAKTNANSQNQTPGLSGSFPTSGAADDVFDIAFTINPGATGTTPVYVTVDTADGPQVTAVLDAGGQPITLNPQPADGGSDPVFGTVTVTQAAALAVTGGFTLSGLQGVTLSDQTLATFTDPNGDDPLGSYSADIQWGDGGTSAATITGPDANDVFTVAGGHLYADASHSPFTLSVTIHRAGSPDASVSDMAQIVVPSLTPNEQYVNDLYEAVLNRPADPEALSVWSNALDSGLAMSVVATALTHSQEYFDDLVGNDFSRLLHRAASAGDVSYWGAQAAGGLTDQQLEAMIAASDEFYADAGGSDQAWVDALFDSFLGRAASPTDETYWAGQVEQGQTRVQVAERIAGSDESDRLIVNADYMQYLGRSADPTALAVFSTQLDNGGRNEDIIAVLASSAEYYARNVRRQ